MDKKIANNIIVGVFVTVGFLGFLFLMFNMGGGEALFGSSYRLFVKFADVRGLHYGSEVTLAGFRIGVVQDVKIPTDAARELTVELKIDRVYQDKIREDSSATVMTQGMLGDKYIELTLGTAEFAAFKPGAFLKAYTEQDLFSKGGSLVDEVKKKFQKGSDLDETMRNLNLVTANLASLTGDIRRERGTMHELIYGTSGAKLNQAVGHLNEIFRKVDEGEGTLGSLVNDPSVYEDVKALLGGAKRSAILRYFMSSFIKDGANSTPAVKESAK